MELLQRSDIATAIAANRESVLGDDTGAEAERFSGELIQMVSDTEADWLFENWDAVLEAMAA